MQSIWQHFFDHDYVTAVGLTNHLLLQTNAAEALHLSGLSLLASGAREAGLIRLWAAVDVLPQPHWYANAAHVAQEQRHFDAALTFAEAGQQRFPEHAALAYAAGNALMSLNRLVEAQAQFEQALRLDPSLVAARHNLGNCFKRQNQADAALACYDAVLQAEPTYLGGIITRASHLLEMGRFAEAEAVFENLASQSDMPEISFLLANCRLRAGDYQRGWALYRRRMDCAMAAAERAALRRPILPTLADAAGKHLLVFGEQGFGDALQFVRYVPLLRRHAARVTLLVRPSLQTLFAGMDPAIPVVTDRDQAIAYDFEVPLLDTPALFGTTLDSIPNALPYLHVEPAALPPIPRDSVRVGLCWAGEKRDDADNAATDARRSLDLSAMQPLFAVERVRFASLQLGRPAQQAEVEPWRSRLEHVLEPEFSFEDTARVIVALDLVITADTAVAHLSAALGVETWILSRFDGCWRWLADRDDSPWYPEVVRLFRQPARGDWATPMAAVAAALRAFVAQNGARSGP